MAESFHRSLFLPGEAGRLEAMLWTSAVTSSDLVALVCHPHPLFGGTMHNKVVFQTAKALHRRSIPVLRFNFRGAGQSEGLHDKGQGEKDDVRTALDFLAGEFPDRPIILAGFSFGSWVGLAEGCEDKRVSDLIGLGIPVNSVSLSYLRHCTKPKLIIQGGNDQFGSRENVNELFDELPEPKKLVFIENADHFFTGKLDQMTAAIGAWLDERYPNRIAVLDAEPS
jgi:alpha/beta superfamily hydrolase